MSRPVLGLIGGAAVIMAVVVFLKLAPLPVVGQTPTATAQVGAAPKTTWGEPDLQGIWTNNYAVPLQRPARYANREFFTDEERAELDRQRAGSIGREATESRRRRGTEQDVSGAYNQAIFTSHKHMGRRTSLIVDPPNGRIPPFTPEATKRRDTMRQFQLALLQATETCKSQRAHLDGRLGCEGGKYGPPSPRRAEPPPYYLAGPDASGGGIINRADGPEDRNMGERCLRPAALPNLGGFFQIGQSPGTVSIFYERGSGHRIIPVTGRPHLPSHVRQWAADSRGRWEGNTLVVDVTNFSAKTEYAGSRENLHLIERWTRIDANTIEYVVTIEDPTTWTRPWTVKQEFSKQSDEANRFYKEPGCHEGNYGMMTLLAGARVEERAFAEGRGPDPATMCTAGCGGFAGGFADEGEDADPLIRADVEP